MWEEVLTEHDSGKVDMVVDEAARDYSGTVVAEQLQMREMERQMEG